MPTTLTEWQKQLEQHYAALAQARVGTPYPLFALEHGLTSDEVRSIKELLRTRIANNEWLALHWLVWVVYATEFGYEYFGDEYWQSFEEFTPHWRERAKREFIRDWFKRFQQKYNGIEPSGKWALYCKNIAWPITHAVLPRYLQNQFAKALHDLRRELARLEDLSPGAIGRYLRENTWNASSRFRQFLQQEELTGRLVLALLANRSVEDESPIYTPTLDRLVADLEVAQNAKEWLQETRRIAAARFQGARTGSRLSGSPSETLTRTTTDRSKARPDLRPRLLLRPSGLGRWSIALEIQSFAPLVDTLSDLRRFLMTTRCRIAGTWSPAGSLLNGPNRQVILKTWPAANIPLLKFEKSNPELEEIVATDVRLSSGPNHLFRMRGDGCASEIVGGITHPGRQYFVLSEGNMPADGIGLKPTIIDCQGVGLAALTIPATTTAEHFQQMQQLGFQLSRTVRIWPAGLPAKFWDGEGASEWLTTDSPCFGIQHDYASVQAYSVSLDAGTPVRLDASASGATFIRVPPLPPGKHLLTVRPIATHSSSLFAAEGLLTLSVREPQPWVPGTTQHSGLFVAVDPPAPSLDDLFDGNLTAAIHGPAGHSVICTISLFKNSEGQESIDITVEFALPVSPSAFARSLSRSLSANGLDWKIFESPAGRLTITGHELGEFVLPLDRELRPVRCACREHHGKMLLRVLEDAPGEEQIMVIFYSFQRPAFPETLKCNASIGIPVPSPGGLFAVGKGDSRAAVVASPPHIQGGLKGLVVNPDLRDAGSNDTDPIPTIELLELWCGARLAGPLAEMRRSRVVNAVLARIYAPYCGDRWAECEFKCSSRPTLVELNALQRMIGGTPGFAAVLRKDYTQAGEAIQPRKQWFADAARRYGVTTNADLCDFALQFASQPQRLLLPYVRPVLTELLGDIKRHSILLRGARLVSILAALDDAATEGILLPRWQW